VRDMHQEMTDLILGSVDSAGAWKPCWQGMGGGLPVNHTTDKKYRGINILSCWISSQSKGYSTSRWASFKQWQAVGGTVRKGEKGTPIIFYKMLEKDDPKDNRPMVRGSHVFNIAQVEGVELYEPTEIIQLDEATRIARIEHWIMQRQGAVRVLHEGNHAFYSPASDHVNMPPFPNFIDAQHYYSTLFHEMTHWTGHKTRLDRLAKYSETTERAKEELIAELGAAFLAAEFGITTHTREDHVSYIASWLKVLKGDKHAIVRAASAASAAVDCLEALEQQALAA
jgi:antirestriction protein ArdC